jgi:hypothetical protein
MPNTHSTRSIFLKLLLLVSIPGLASADVAITSGTTTAYNSCCSHAGPVGSGTFALQGQNLSLNAFGTTYYLLSVSANTQTAQTVTFNPASTQVYPPLPSSIPLAPQTIKLVYNGVTYTDADFVTFSISFAGSPVTVPNTVTPNPGQIYEAQVTNVPFTMSGTITVHSGSFTGPATLTIPISGAGVYKTSAIGMNAFPNSYQGEVTYQFQPPSTTSFRMDLTTQGSWNGKYGTEGYLIPNGAQSLPFVTVTGAQTYTWAGLTTDSRALQNGPAAINRIASTFYGSNFNFDLNMTDGLTHQVALYLLDWDTTTRTQTITITDIPTGALIDTQNFSGFNAGQFAIFNLKGRVRINLTAPSAVVSGLFIDPGPGVPPPPPPTLTLSATPVTITTGTSGSSTLSVNGFPSPVTFTATNWPIGITGTFGAAANINVASNVAPGFYSLTVNGNGGGQTATTSIPLTVAAATPPPPSPSGTVVSFVESDDATQGSWIGKYGGDGHLIANGVSALPSYAAVNVNGASTYTWAQATTDPRALRTSAGSTTGIAASYYGNTFNIGVNLLDGAVHRVALYVLDWENSGRQVTITITDAVTNAMLYQNNIASFQNGKYAVWNIKGNVNINLSRIQGNAVFSGIFFGPAAPLTLNPGFTISATPATATAGSSTTSTVSVIPFNGFNGPVAFSAGSWPAGITGSLTNTQPSTATINVASSVAPGTYNLSVTGSNSPIITTTSITLTVNAAPPTPPANGPFATFTGLDATTQGAWSGKYGAAGYLIANGAVKNPTFGFANATGASTFTWAGSTTDPRALQTSPSASTRIASTYTQYPNTGFSFNVVIGDGGVHKVAFYLLDWDNGNRTQTIAILDAATGAILDSQTISAFNNGLYAVWNVKGNVIVKVTPASGTAALVSGLFFD